MRASAILLTKKQLSLSDSSLPVTCTSLYCQSDAAGPEVSHGKDSSMGVGVKVSNSLSMMAHLFVEAPYFLHCQTQPVVATADIGPITQT